MITIAYCDDMKKDRDRIMFSLRQIGDKWGEEFDLTSFSSGESLCEAVSKKHYDIILLDILMNGIDGIETATRIRAMGEEALIIFISSYDERVKELFKFGTIGFLDKPVQTNQLEETLLQAFSILKRNQSIYFTFSKNGSIQYIPVKDILYFESRRNEIVIHTTKNQENFYGTLASVWEKLQSSDQFIMPHRSFIFNLHHISIKADKVIIKNSVETVNIGEKYREDTRNRHLAFLEKRWK